ncbi:Wzz/FepE/Etk N-terminal domain-containing protein [Actinorhabdospora filicis]|nr:Wzz/FepE/Etk N-terminal domain-containing protein [Actinorhabdospora filicis]
MDTGRTTSTYHLSDMLVAVKRGRTLLLALLGAGLAVGAALAVTTPAEYVSHTQVLVRPTGVDDPNVSGGRTKGELNLDTEAQLVKSTAVADRALEILGGQASAQDLAAHVTVEVPANTSVLTIGFSGGSAVAAHDGAAAFATAYLEHREATAKETIDTEIKGVDANLESLRGQLAQVSTDLAAATAADRVVLGSNKDLLSRQIEELTSRRSELDGKLSTLAGGKVISEAVTPSSPDKPIVWLDVAGGGTAGLLAGFGAVLARERFSRTVRRAADLPERCGVPLLVELPASVAPRFADVYGAYGPAGKVFGRLRNELIAALPERGRVLLVVGVDEGPGATVVAANLAAAFARADLPTAAVAAHASPYLALPDMLGTPSVPGLADVITGRADLDEATVRAARHPRLSVLGAGSAARAGGWPNGAMRQITGALAQTAEFVVVEAPPASGDADAQRLAAECDAVLLVAESERTRLSAVSDLAEQLRRVNTPLLGAVVLPRFKKRRPDAPETVPTVQAGSGAPEPRFERAGAEALTEIMPAIPAQHGEPERAGDLLVAADAEPAGDTEAAEAPAGEVKARRKGRPCPRR